MNPFKSYLYSLLIILSMVALPRISMASSVKVALVFRHTDKYDPLINQIMIGIKLAYQNVASRNKHLRIEFVNIDHDETVDSMIRAADQVIAQKISLVIGAEKSTEALVLGERFKDKGIIFISPTATNTKVRTGRPDVFTISPPDDLVAASLSRFFVTQFESGRIGVIQNVSSPYSNDLTSNFLQSLADQGFKSTNVFVEKALAETMDFAATVEKFKQQKVTHVAILGYQSLLGKFFSQAAGKQFFPIYIGSDGWGTDEMVVNLFVNDRTYPNLFQGYRTSYWSGKASQSMHNKILKLVSPKPVETKLDAWLAIGYDSGTVLFESLAKTGLKATSTNVRKILQRTLFSNLLTSRTIRFGTENSPSRDVHIFKISSKGSEFIKTVEPSDSK